MGMLPEFVRGVLTRLENAGFEAWCVGGCVRDLLLDRCPADWDVTTSALPEQTLALMTYMLEHNRSHAEELHNIAHALENQGRHEAANLVGDAVHYFGHCNDKLEEALRLVKGE